MTRKLKVAAGSYRDRLADGADSDVHEQGGNGPDRRLGALLRDMGRLDDGQIAQVLAQQEHRGRRFGELAVALGLVSYSDVAQALCALHALDFVPARDGGRLPRELGELQDSMSESGETLRSARSQLMLRWFGEDIEQHTLAIISPDRGDGRTFICAALATLIAQLDEDVLVVDADLRRPRLHQLLQVDNSSGLSTWLAEPGGRPTVYAAPGLERLHVLPAGPVPPNPAELLTRRHFALLLRSLAQRYPFVLIDTPPAMSCGEALTVAVRSSGCLLVTRRDRSRVVDTQELAEALNKHGVELVGAIVNDC